MVLGQIPRVTPKEENTTGLPLDNLRFRTRKRNEIYSPYVDHTRIGGICSINKPTLRHKREQLPYGEIMVLSVFRVEHAIVVVEIYASVFPLCKHIATPKSDRKSH